jgi:hypothetical protein
MDVLKHKDNPADATNAIKVLLQEQQKWLVFQLRGTALVRNTYNPKTVGSNVSWDISNGVEGASDAITGRRFQPDQVLFRKPVKLLLCGVLNGEGKEWTVNIKGTTIEVLEKICSEYKKFDNMGDEKWFQGLSKVLEGKHKGKYLLDLEA